MSAITGLFSELTEKVCDLALKKGNGKSLNSEVKDYCELLTKAIEENPEAFQQALEEHPKDLYAWKETIAKKTEAIEKAIEKKGRFGRFADGIRRLCCCGCCGNTTASLKKINSLLEKVCPKREGFPKKQKHDGYFFLRVSTDTQSCPRLEKKAKLRGMKTCTLFMKDNDPEGKLKELTHRSKLYINGHGRTNDLEISGDDGNISTRNLADFLAEKAPQLIKNQDELASGEMLTISLLVCYGADKRDEYSLDFSFAESLSVALGERGIPCKVKGALGETSVHEEKGIIKKLVDDQRSTPESHKIFMNEIDPRIDLKELKPLLSRSLDP